MILKKTKQTGTIELDFIMSVGIFLFVIIGAFTLYGSARDSQIEKGVNYLGFMYHLSLSTGNGVIVYNDKEAKAIQKTVISTLDCSKNYCKPLSSKLSIGAFISINYKNGIAEDVKVYSTHVSSIFFKNNKASSSYYDNFHVSETMLNDYPDYGYPLTIQKKITHEYYLETDLINPVNKDICTTAGLKCLDVLHYKH